MEDIYFDDFIRHKLYGSQGYYKSSLTINEKNDFIEINICIERKDFVKSPVKIFNKKEK